MPLPSFARTGSAVAAAATLALLPSLASAQAAGPWRYELSIYAYLPSLSGNNSFPTGGSSIEVDVGGISDNLQMAFMGSLDAHNGRWGVYTDVVYVDLGGDKQGSRDFTIAGVLPVGTSANLDWNLRGTVWTIAGQYRTYSDPAWTVDALAGARMADLRTSLGFDISGSLGSLAPASRSGKVSRDQTNWDAIVGVKGRYRIPGGSGRWSIPYYLDIGAGESRFTWQATVGVAYTYSWGDVSLHWRHLSYEMKSGNPLSDIAFSGPMFAATFRF